MSRTRKIVILCGAVAVLIGLIIMAIPFVEQWLYDINADKQITEFDAKVEAYKEDEPESSAPPEERYLSDLYAAMQKYNKDIYENGQSGLKDPFSYAEPSFDLKAWGIEDGIFGYIDIPAMDVKLPLYLGANDENMRLGAVQLSQTSLPIGGENTNCVIAGHRGYHGATMFRSIENMQVGDELTITNLWETLTYRCVETKAIRPNEIDQVLIQPGKDMVTLISCHPYRQHTHRYVVYCERVQDEGVVN